MASKKDTKKSGQTSGRKSKKKKTRYRVNKRRVGCLAFILILLSALTAFIFYQRDTVVTGAPESLTGAYGKPLTVTVNVSPARGRKVILQRKDGDKWTDIDTVKAESGRSADVKLTFPSDWSRTDWDDSSAESEWRIYIPDKIGAKEWTGENFYVRAGNLKDIPGLDANAALIIREDDGQILYAKDIHKRIPNASTTKLMTALLTQDEANSDREVTVSEHVKNTHDGNLYKEVGDRFLMKDLWRAMLISSSNDSAVAIAETAGGSEQNFVTMMNDKALELGMNDTHFMNAYGWDDEDHYSSAFDLALLIRKCAENETFREVTMMKEHQFTAVNEEDRLNIMHTTNKLLKEDYPGTLGGKTGSTLNAGGCYVGRFEYGGQVYIIVLLGSDDRWENVQKLCDYLRTNYVDA